MNSFLWPSWQPRLAADLQTPATLGRGGRIKEDLA